jgi:hypothetical protein
MTAKNIPALCFAFCAFGVLDCNATFYGPSGRFEGYATSTPGQTEFYNSQGTFQSYATTSPNGAEFYNSSGASQGYATFGGD